jgi:transposase
MRGEDRQQHEMFSYGSLEERVPADHPLRPIRQMVDEALKTLDGRFEALYEEDGRKSIPPERLLRALLVQMLYSIRSERMLMEQLEYNLLFRWFVGLSMNEPVWHATVFTKNRDRLLEGEIAGEFFQAVLKQARRKRLLSNEHFTVDGTLIEAWAGQKSFQLKDEDDILKPPPPPDRGSNPTIDYRKQKRSNDTHQSKTDPLARLFKKTRGAEARLCYFGHVLTENRNGLVVNTRVTLATGTAERDAAISMADDIPGGTKRVTLGADRAYDTRDFVEQLRERCVTQRHRPSRHGSYRLRDQPTQTQARGGSLRLDEDGRPATQDQIQRTRQGRMDVHFRGGSLQPGPDAKPDGAVCLIRL